MAAAYTLGVWSLADLFPSIDAPEVDQAIQRTEQLVLALEALRPALSSDMGEAEFVAVLQAYDAMLRTFFRLEGYAGLAFAQDTQDGQAQSFQARMQQMAAEVDNRTLFIKLWWKELDDDAAARLMAASGDFAYALEALRLQKPYTLSEAVEQVINLKDVNGAAALVTLYDSMTNRYVFHLNFDGQVQEMTFAELMTHRESPDPEMRAATYRELFRVYGQDAPILGQIYQHRMRDWRSENLDLRGFHSPIAVRNLSNNIPDEVVDTLLEVCRRNAPLFQRYYRLKARWLGLDRLRRYDLYAPMAPSDKRYEYGPAVELVLDSFRQFDPGMDALARRVFDQNHVDSETRRGKRSGAFCASISPELTPWVLTSFQGRPRDVATLAHELGHAVHDLLAAHHTALTAQPSLPLAETASTFGEMMLVDRMLAEESDADVRRDLLFRQMDDAYATILRQAYFALFEREAAERIHAGARVEDLSGLYAQNLAEQFGDSVELSDDFSLEWVVVPHFVHTPFYVYAYAFGQLLVLSLYRQYRQEGSAFKPRYLRILAAGGSDAPTRILQQAGIDVRSEAFWQGGFDVLRGSLESLEALPLPAGLRAARA